MRRSFPEWIRKNTALPWAALFLLLSISVTQFGGMNALSRVAALRAITEGHVLNIDNYTDWTIDWSRAPNGHFYSNKAPGAVFLGLPFFALTDAFVQVLNKNNLDKKGRIPAPGYLQHLLLMLWLQLVPAFLLVLWISRTLSLNSAPPAAIHFFSLSVLFGNTASIYMNCNFGHGLAAILFLAAVFFWFERSYGIAGACLSFSLLTDYGVAFTLPFFIASTVWRERDWRALVSFALGAIPAGCLWIWYHSMAFGSPFATANQFINPEQVELLPGASAFSGTYSHVPDPVIVQKLLFGSSRGILFTQPWIFGIFILPFLRTSAPRGLALLAIGSFAGVLWMNGGFGSWHGGWCAGPRYLSAVLPACGFAIALAWTSIPPVLRAGLWLLLGFSLCFRLLVYPFSNLAPNENLWSYYFQLFFEKHGGTGLLRFSMGVLFAVLAVYWQQRRGEIHFRKSQSG